MTTDGSKRDVVTAVREPRPFLYLKPASLPLGAHEVDARDTAQLNARLEPAVPRVARSIVDYTIAEHNAQKKRTQPIQLSVLNRRRRAARAWLQLIAQGRVDAGARHVVATQWLPLLCGTGPDLQLAAAPARALVEFVRGAITACIFDRARPNLLGEARALHALEATLSVHLGAVQEAIATAGERRPAAGEPSRS